MGTTFRRPSARLTAVIIFVIAYPLVSWRITQNVDAPFDSILIGLFAALVVAGLWQTWRLAVTLRPDGVLVRNSWRDHYLPWADIRGIDLESSRIQRVSFLMSDGRVVPCDAMRGWAFGDEPHSRALVQAVTERLAAQERRAD
ncbi:PH domain-containing protein [Lentzea sp. NPDC051213]|uniref:PH domain-containing protein n=1 Tax=Lentzea sp. NPDC051213 TaxID=3364126 RepID=UPI00379D533E